MMKTKITTIEKKYKDKTTGEWKSTKIEYAKVADRLQMFKTHCPHGVIDTTVEIKGDYIFAKSLVTKDKSDINSSTATGHAIAKLTGYEKEFEKLETLAVGRALAFLGYGASGEIASSEEMEEFNSYQTEKKEDAIESINKVKTVEELKKVFLSLSGGLMAEKEVVEAKNSKYKALTTVEIPVKKKKVDIDAGEVDPSLIPAMA